MVTREHIWQYLERVCDPEIPVLSIRDLGVVRDVQVHPDGSVEVVITPTYTGCPAMSLIEANILVELKAQGIDQVRVTTVLSPPWTTDWMTDSGREKLRAFGIAPPQQQARMERLLFGADTVPCPFCGSENTEMTSQFGSTSCKALYRCKNCLEPFDYFKCH